MNTPQPAATTARPIAASVADRFTPSTNNVHPASAAPTVGSSADARSSGCASHFGPAVNRKPQKKSGVKPNVISSEWASTGETRHNTGQPSRRDHSTPIHHNALAANITPAPKNASRCGAASSQ